MLKRCWFIVWSFSRSTLFWLVLFWHNFAIASNLLNLRHNFNNSQRWFILFIEKILILKSNFLNFEYNKISYGQCHLFSCSKTNFYDKLNKVIQLRLTYFFDALFTYSAKQTVRNSTDYWAENQLNSLIKKIRQITDRQRLK